MPRQCWARPLVLSFLTRLFWSSEQRGTTLLECHIWHTYFGVTQRLQIRLSGYGPDRRSFVGTPGLHSVRGVALRLTSKSMVVTVWGGGGMRRGGMGGGFWNRNQQFHADRDAQRAWSGGLFLAYCIGHGPWHNNRSQGCHLHFKSATRLDWNCMTGMKRPQFGGSSRLVQKEVEIGCVLITRDKIGHIIIDARRKFSMSPSMAFRWRGWSCTCSIGLLW